MRRLSSAFALSAGPEGMCSSSLDEFRKQIVDRRSSSPCSENLHYRVTDQDSLCDLLIRILGSSCQPRVEFNAVRGLGREGCAERDQLLERRGDHAGASTTLSNAQQALTTPVALALSICRFSRIFKSFISTSFVAVGLVAPRGRP
jgi:hypothetical protein